MLGRMVDFELLVFVGLVALVLVFVALGVWYPGSGAAQVDWKPTRSPELEVELEMQDVDEMLEAANERRRRSGRPELSEDGLRAEIAEHEREQRERSDGA
jgi:hypothetical protein